MTQWLEYCAEGLLLTLERVWTRVHLPLASRGIAAGLTLGFAHTLGEFGVVLMIGGSIPGVTKVASIALYDEVQSLNYPQAHAFAALLLALSFVLILAATLYFGRSAGGAAIGMPERFDSRGRVVLEVFRVRGYHSTGDRDSSNIARRCCCGQRSSRRPR